ncbi:MAG: helix-turn-helix domain-containing protein [Candidatus Thermoplasmatota archaeon]
MSSFKKVIWWLIANSAGGNNRGLIIDSLFNKPKNTNELSKKLKLSYKTVQYHLHILEKNEFVTSVGDKYGVTFFPSEKMEQQKDYFYQVWNKTKKES